MQPAPYLVDVPEFGDRLRAGAFRRGSLADQFFDPSLEMKTQLVVDVGAHVAAPEPEVAVPARGSHGSGATGTATITRATAAA